MLADSASLGWSPDADRTRAKPRICSRGPPPHAAVVSARPARPTLTLKGKVPAPPQPVLSKPLATGSGSQVEPVAIMSATKPAPVASAVATDVAAKPARPFQP